MKHFLYMPLLGLGLFGGSRGSRWLRNRIKILKQFVVPSLLNQTDKNFTLWVSVRPEDRGDKQIIELEQFLKTTGLDVIFTFGGLCIFDDKFSDKEANERLLNNLHKSLGELLGTNVLDNCDEVLMTIQPSDDCYHKDMVQVTQDFFKLHPEYQATSFQRGYIMNYLTKEIAEYNPTTNPPFYTIKFSKADFIDPRKHATYTALKKDVGKYKTGTPCPSHEYLPDCLKTAFFEDRGFMVGCHTENVSTHFTHPFKGRTIDDKKVLRDYGLEDVNVLKLKVSWRKWLMRQFPHNWQRKLRYIFGERLFNRFYLFIRN